LLYGDESGIMAAKEVVSVFRDREKELDRLNRQLLEEDRLADNSDGNGYVDLGCKAGWYAEFD